MMMQVVKQESLRTEKYTKNGVKKEVHVVVKRLPFVLKLRGSNVNFHSDSITSTVLFEEGDKAVGFVSKSPLEFVAHVSADGSEATIEVRLSCLSSQCEGNLFKLRFSAGNAHADSAPIKVISKAGTALPKEPKTVGGGTKRTINQVVERNISRLADQQQAILDMQQRQLEVLQQLAGVNNSVWPSPDLNSPCFDTPLSPLDDDRSPVDFSRALRNLVVAYRSIETPERASKVQKAMLSLDDEGQTDISDFVKFLNAERSSSPDPFAYGFPDMLDESMVPLAQNLFNP